MIFILILCAVLGVAIKNGKMYWLIAGYNTMSKEEKAKVDIEGIATLFRNVMFVMALAISLLYIATLVYDNPKVESVGTSFIVVVGVLYLIIRSNSSKYKINPQD